MRCLPETYLDFYLYVNIPFIKPLDNLFAVAGCIDSPNLLSILLGQR